MNVDPNTLAQAIALALKQIQEGGPGVPQSQPVVPLPSSSVEDTSTPTPGTGDTGSPLLLPPSVDPQERSGQIHSKLQAMKQGGPVGERDKPPLVAVSTEVYGYMLDWMDEIDPSTDAGKREAAALSGMLTRLGDAIKHWNSDHARVQLKDNSGWEEHAETLIRLLGMADVQQVMTQHLNPSIAAAVSEASAMLMVRIEAAR